jgi:DNA-binding IclR family transcriptional regulator
MSGPGVLGQGAEAITRDPTVKTVERVARILKGLAGGGIAGWRLTDLAHHVGLGKATVHRLLLALIENGLAFQDSATRRYHPGASLAMMGTASTAITVATGAAQCLKRLASATDDTVFVSIPEGPAAICVGREVGAFPIKILTLDVGDRRPLGVGAASLALLAAMSDEEIEVTLSRNREWLSSYPGFGAEILKERVRQTREQGYAVNRGGIVPAMSALGVAVPSPLGSPIAAFSVAAITERIVGRIDTLVDLMRDEAATLSRLLYSKAGQ